MCIHTHTHTHTKSNALRSIDMCVSQYLATGEEHGRHKRPYKVCLVSIVVQTAELQIAAPCVRVGTLPYPTKLLLLQTYLRTSPRSKRAYSVKPALKSASLRVVIYRVDRSEMVVV
jgi:hypothetical protein